MIRVNLIPMQLRMRRKLVQRKGRWCAAIIGYVVALAMTGGVWRMAMGNMPDLTGQIRRVHGEIDLKSAELTRLTAALAESRSALELSRAMKGQPDWGILLALLVKMRGDDVVLDHCEISAPSQVLGATKGSASDRAILKVQGFGRTQAAVSSFALRLEQIGLFDSIERVSNRQSQAGLDAVAFTLECQLKTSAATTQPSPSMQASIRSGGSHE